MGAGDGLLVRGYISTALWCPYEGRMAPQRTLDVMLRLLDLGVDDISLGDTLGRASPADIRALLDALMPHIESMRLSLHVHDTYGMAVANVLGSSVGTKLALQHGAGFVRIVFLVVVAALVGKTGWDAWRLLTP